MHTRSFLEATIERATQQLALIETFGEDEYEDGSVLVFDKRLDNGRTYSYAVIRTNGRWYTTGPRMGNTPLTWEQLRDWMAGGYPVEEVLWVTDLEVVAS